MLCLYGDGGALTHKVGQHFIGLRRQQHYHYVRPDRERKDGLRRGRGMNDDYGAVDTCVQQRCEYLAQLRTHSPGWILMIIARLRDNV